MEQGYAFVKFSAAYRIVDLENMDALKPIAREFLRVKDGMQVIFGTDWPQTRMEDLDVEPFILKMLTWVDTEDLREKVFKLNINTLWEGY